MSSPRWRKILGDLGAGRGRVALMVAALAVSLFAMGSTLGSFGILSRELGQAYQGSRPASATIETERVTPALVERIRALPGVRAAEGRATLRARVMIKGEWRPLVLFVVPDFNDMRLATFQRLEGAWPPPPGTLLVEHMAVPCLGGAGRRVLVKPPTGEPKELSVSGVVWDSALAPAAMEQMVWGYITPETLALLGDAGGLDEVKLAVQGGSGPIERTARQVAAWLQAQGHPVREIQVPPPGQHPHQGQMNAVMLMFNVFSLFALLLSGVLVGNTVAAMMARQVREIGILKALGASRGQVLRLYLAMMLLLGGAAWTLALPPTLATARALAGSAAANLNLRIASTALPWWALAAQAGAAILVPLLAALLPVLKASRTTVQHALHQVGASLDAFGMRRSDAWLSRLRHLGPLGLLSLRNTFRRRGRLILTLALLAGGGAMFMTGLNFDRAWSLRLAEVNTGRSYDATIRLQHPENTEKIRAAFRNLPRAVRMEAWGTAPAAWGEAPGAPVVRTYPDKGHGSFQVTGIPPDTGLIHFPIVAGRWLEPGDEDAVVLNHMAAASVPGVRPGDTVSIAMNGTPRTWRVAGMVRELGAQATAYIPLGAFQKLTGTEGRSRLLAVSTPGGDPQDRKAALRQVESALQEAGIGIDIVIPVAMLRTAMSTHMSVLLGLILGLAGLMTVVGVLGLTATMSINVLERTRELGVMRAVGATPGRMMAVILGEGLAVGLLSTGLAVLLSLPFTAAVNRIVGSLAFRMPLPLSVSPLAILSWVAMVLCFSGAASLLPALRASRLSVREALDYV